MLHDVFKREETIISGMKLLRMTAVIQNKNKSIAVQIYKNAIESSSFKNFHSCPFY